MNKKGGYSDLFILMIMAFIILIISGLFIYMGTITKTKLHETLDSRTDLNVNTSQVIDNTFGKVPDAYNLLYWLSMLIITGMILSIFIGSYLVTTRPIFFVPYIFILIIAIVLSVIISNSYEMIITNPTLSSTFTGFTMSNYFMINLPIWITIVGFMGGIIMYSRIGSNEQRMNY